MNPKPIQVLIVDDSKVARDLLSYIVSSDPGLNVIGTAENGEQALTLIQNQKPDVLITDIVMPKMDGFKLTRHIMSTNPIPIIIVSGIYNKQEIDRSFQAIEAGALAILEKPKGIGDAQYLDTARFVIETIKALAEVKLEIGNTISTHKLTSAAKDSRALPLVPPVYSPAIKARDSASPVKAVAIGASIGGPQALYTILSALTPQFSAPILIVQHIAPGFVQGLVNWLRDSTSLNIVVPENKQKALPGYVYIAPEKVHMEITRENLIKLVPEIHPKGDLPPSIGRLFRSMALELGSQGVGILLTGVGKDGTEDLLLMKEKGALTIVQDDKTAVKPDMPREAIRLGAAKRIVPLPQIGPMLENLVNLKSASNLKSS